MAYFDTKSLFGTTPEELQRELFDKSQQRRAQEMQFLASNTLTPGFTYGMLQSLEPLRQRYAAQGEEGIARFLRKVWRLVLNDDGTVNPKISDTLVLDAETDRVLHATIQKVTEDYEALGFNTAISQMMICLNQLTKAEAVSRAAVEAFLKLLAPLAPHQSEELWQRMGHSGSIIEAGWPQFDASKLEQDTVKIVFQVNGKYRGDAELPKDIDKAEAIATAKMNERVQNFIEGKTIKKEIYVPGKIVNIVAG